MTTTHRGDVQRLLADAMTGLDLATVDESVRVVLDHLQVVSGRLALRLVGQSSLATEAVSLAALMAHLRRPRRAGRRAGRARSTRTRRSSATPAATPACAAAT